MNQSHLSPNEDMHAFNCFTKTETRNKNEVMRTQRDAAAMRSQRSKVGHTTRKAQELKEFGRQLTRKERSFKRFMLTYLNEIFLPQCNLAGLDPVAVLSASQNL